MPTASFEQRQYGQALRRIRILQARLAKLAAKRGNLDPTVLSLSQEIDRHIVTVQRFWQSQPSESDWVVR